MANYIVPQVLINQLISEVQLNTIKNQNVLVIGPNYALFRYADAGEKGKCYIGQYDGAIVKDASGDDAATITDFREELLPVDLRKQSEVTGVIPYPEQPAGSTPDASYAKLYADNVVIKLFTAVGFNKMDDASAGADLDGRLRFDFVLAGKNRGKEVEYTPEDSNDEASVKVLDTVKYDLKRDIVKGDVIRIPLGANANGKPEFFESIVNDVFESVPGSDVYDCLQLEDTIPEEILAQAELIDVDFCAMFDAAEIPQKMSVNDVNNWNWTTYSDPEDDVYGIVVDGGMKIAYSNWGDGFYYADIIEADLYIQYRALLTTATTDIQTIASHTLVENALGTIHPDNPLAFGVYMAALNSGDRLVYYCGVATDDLSGYNTVLDKASLSDEVYMIVPLTQSETVIDSVKAHVEEMSTAENKLWRIGFVCQAAPTTDMIYDATSNVDKEPFYAKFLDSKRHPGVYDLMEFMWDDNEEDDRANTVVKCLSQVEPGDVVKVYTENTADTWDDTPKYTEYQVRKVVSNTVLQLTTGVDIDPLDDHADGYESNASGLCCGPDHHYKVEVYRKLSHARQAKYIADLSSSLATRRMYNVFPTVASTDGVAFGGEFLAAAAAGLVSSVLPQQPVTNVELNGIGDVPLVYQTFSRAELNTIAAGGTFIIMQDRPGSQVYVRHQISTAYSEGNLLKAELSITKNLDSISYYFAELFAPLIGKYNITPELLDVIRSRLNGGLAALESETAAGLYGPQVLADGTEILELRQSEVNRDHVYAKVHLNLPVPFNYFDLDLEI